MILFGLSDLDPILKGKVLAANLGCAVPYYNSPYFRLNAASRTPIVSWLYLSSTVIATILLAVVAL
jgi:hypothetical protein